uniref:non-specific serine/threonine protein kinase n=1 Tax=Arcella intermedia TaxID=1963864 RepID=A0A6B2LEU2_9EUKA
MGEGGFAVVKRASNVETREKVAIKIVQKTIQADQEAIALIKREIKILHLIEHFSCVSFIESRETNESIYIVMEYVGGGDLLDCILSAHGFDEPQAAKVLRDVLRGLQYLHGIGVCHRDIKPENVLHHIQDDIWKIADFGCATTFTTTEPLMSEFEGTIQYMAPEVLVGEKYTKAVDVWATGVISYVSLSACFPWEGKTDAEIQESIVGYRIKFYSPEFDETSSDCIAFILSLLEFNPAKRISVEEALNHPWLKANT